MGKLDVCPMHCPDWMLWLFTALGAWFVLGDARVLPIFGGFWSWLVLLSGACAWMCASNPAHKKSDCWFANLPVWNGIVLALVGAWFVLGDTGVLPTLGISLLHLVLLIGAAGLIAMKR